MITIYVYNSNRGNTFIKEYNRLETAKKFLMRIKDKLDLYVEDIECDPSIRKELTDLL